MEDVQLPGTALRRATALPALASCTRAREGRACGSDWDFAYRASGLDRRPAGALADYLKADRIDLADVESSTSSIVMKEMPPSSSTE
jgi:hypothetical protein